MAQQMGRIPTWVLLKKLTKLQITPENLKKNKQPDNSLALKTYYQEKVNVLICDKLFHQQPSMAAICEGTQEMICHGNNVGSAEDSDRKKESALG